MKNYAEIRQSIIDLGLKTTTFLDRGDGHERTAGQRKISKILRDAGCDLAEIAGTCRAQFPLFATKNRLRLTEAFIVFRGPWQVRHLLFALVEIYRRRRPGSKRTERARRPSPDDTDALMAMTI